MQSIITNHYGMDEHPFSRLSRSSISICTNQTTQALADSCCCVRGQCATLFVFTGLAVCVTHSYANDSPETQAS